MDHKPMKTNHLFSIAMLFSVSTLLFSPADLQAQSIKCWTNNEGVRECGNSVPPEFAQQGHEERSRQGMLLEQQQRAKTPEELAEEAKLTAQRAEEKRQLEQQAREDKVLLATFSTIADIEKVRDERLKAIESSIRLAERRTGSIQADLDKRIQAAADAERAGNAPNEALLKDIDSLRRQVNANNSYIADRQKEQEETQNKYAADIERFKTLKSR
jgi:hypothetical protein